MDARLLPRSDPVSLHIGARSLSVCSETSPAEQGFAVSSVETGSQRHGRRTRCLRCQASTMTITTMPPPLQVIRYLKILYCKQACKSCLFIHYDNAQAPNYIPKHPIIITRSTYIQRALFQARRTLSESQSRRVPISSSQRRPGLRLRPHDKVLVLDCDTLCHVVHFVHADQARSKLKHVVS